MRKFKPIIFGVAFLSACTVTPADVQAKIDTFNAWAGKIVTDANGDVAAVAQAGLPALCSAVGVLDADVGTAALVSAKVAQAQPVVDAAAQAFIKSPSCMNPSSVTNIASAVAVGVATAKDLQAAIKSDSSVVQATPAPLPALVPST